MTMINKTECVATKIHVGKPRPNGMFETSIECKSIRIVYLLLSFAGIPMFLNCHRPIKWDEVERDLRSSGVADVIHVEARHSIEDWFLHDAKKSFLSFD